EEQQRLKDAAVYLIRLDHDVHYENPDHAEVVASVERGKAYLAEQQQLLDMAEARGLNSWKSRLGAGPISGGFKLSALDVPGEFLNKNDEIVTRVIGGAQAVRSALAAGAYLGSVPATGGLAAVPAAVGVGASLVSLEQGAE